VSLKQNSHKIINDSILNNISSAVAGLNYGTVLITVHDKKITQVEISEKQRFDEVWKIEGGGGI